MGRASMNQYKFDVIIIGAGPAGVAAAGALAGTGLSIAVLEAGVYAGAENWSGCVYFAENLAAGDCFGPGAVEAAPFERRVTRRGTLLHNGLDVVGVEISNPDIFSNCFTVLRPLYDPYFANLAQAKGAVLITGTTVTSLIRNNGRVSGVETRRGPLFAEVVFIAEGDASHLVRSEQLERAAAPHFLQGVKAVLSLSSEEIEKRFRLGAGEGAAYELLLRNASLAGRTTKLNVGGFLYTNRDSLSVGYVVPLDNVRSNYRGEHDKLFEWMRGLPYVKELTEGSTLSAYGAKIIRSGGWKERPILVEDGLVVGGASVGLGVDIPFPNFTGPASASGLFFARAIKGLLKEGKALDAKNLTRAYLTPLKDSVYGRNAQYLSAWPGYFGRSKALFGRTVDMACGTSHFLTTHGTVETGRFMRAHILSFHGLRESIMDTMRAISALRLWKPCIKAALNPVTLGAWLVNLVKAPSPEKGGFDIIMHIGGKKFDSNALPMPLRGLVGRISPALSRALSLVYANDDVPAERKFSEAVRIMLRSIRLSDFIVLPAYCALLFLAALGTALWDAFRFFILKTPVEKLLAEPVMAYNETLRKVRDLDAIRPAVSLDAKLATNTYLGEETSHIRTLWPATVKAHPDMSQAGLWWVCPARVYGYEAPLFGRGRVTVNFENCIKCESCWRAEPGRVLWGRHTDHNLIYRPESAVMPTLLHALTNSAGSGSTPARPPEIVDEKIWYLSRGIIDLCQKAIYASAAFADAVSKLPASADTSRREWPLALGRRLCGDLARLETALMNDSRRGLAGVIQSGRKDIELRLVEGQLFHALYCSRGIERRIQSWIDGSAGTPRPALSSGKAATDNGLTYEEVSKLFPDQIVKTWEEDTMPRDWAEKLRAFIFEHREDSLQCIRVLSSVSPALGLIAAHHLFALRVTGAAGAPGLCAVTGEQLNISESEGGMRIQGVLNLVPLAASTALLVISRNRGQVVPLPSPGVTLTSTPAIGFRAAALSDIALDCTIKGPAINVSWMEGAPDTASYLAIALGAGDYLCKRIKEHAAGRVQFPGQMLDTEGRDGIAKLGAVKALIARTEAWRLLLETLHYTRHTDTVVQGQAPDSERESGLLHASLAAMAFGPDPGSMGYDAGQVFGGFAYSEDDLLSRFYRDSALFRFLAPGHDASRKLRAALGNKYLGALFPGLGDLGGIQGEPLVKLALEAMKLAKQCSLLPAEADPGLAGAAAALALGIRGLLVGIENGLLQGKSLEAEAADAEVLLGLCREALLKATISAGRGRVSPAALFPIEPFESSVKLDLDYESFCAAAGPPHASGGFLISAFDRSPRFVPEIQLHDVKLSARWTGLAAWFKQNCRDKKFDGRDVERYIESVHRLPDEVLQAVKKHKWLATYIPKALDGLGWHKAEYYILNSVAGSFGDAGINLLIMASTSIGTTPILLGLDDELPRVREELEPLARDRKQLGELDTRLGKLIRTLSNPNPAWIKKEYAAVMKLVDSRIRHTRVVKYLAANFLRAFYGAGIAGRRGDFSGFTANLRHSGELFGKLIPDIRAALDELPRRERCHKLFLRYLGHGGVSAFALTEPTAGSDSGGVKTLAKLKSAKLTRLDDGRYSFHLDDRDEAGLRYLVDADRIAFLDGGVAYQSPDGQTLPVMYDKYDYATDRGLRYYIHQGRECPFHDIAQVREMEAGPSYEYYMLTGAKMWITNGSLATQFCLYAQTPEGVTGFMVDRHAEGLIVGADEKKTGQRGSPTNEISLDGVRVPREAVIGYEGHGQVNALETLNVGRCGLAVVSGALMRKLMREASTGIAASPERDRLLGEAAAILFGSESLAYYLIGLFDRPRESVRMESAIAKYACSEDIHEYITLIEYAYGPVGQTEKYLLEKARRDSRILTIYEGTNEVQRFLIVKDLISLATHWPALPVPQDDQAARVLAEWKNRLRSLVKDAAALLGDTSWSDAMLQPALFPLSEMAGEILRLDCIYYRREWLEARAAQLGRNYAVPLLQAGARAAERTISRLAHLDSAYMAACEQIRKSLDMPEVRAADAALDKRPDRSAPDREAQALSQAPLRVLCIVRPVAELSPSPGLAEGSIQELIWKLDPHDHSGLIQTLLLKQGNSSPVTMDALMAGQAGHERLLRLAAGAAADRLVRLDIDGTSAEELAAAVRTLERSSQYDLIVIGSHCMNGDEETGSYLAGALGRAHYQREMLQVHERIALPSVISITKLHAGAERSMAAIVQSTFSPVTVLGQVAAASATNPPRFERPSGAASGFTAITGVEGAADYLKAYARAESQAKVNDYTEKPGRGSLSDDGFIWAMLDPRDQKSNVAVLRACKQLSEAFNRRVCALVPSPRDRWPSLLGVARGNGADRAFCMDTGKGMLSMEGKLKALRLIVKAAETPLVAAAAGWTQAFGLISGEASLSRKQIGLFGNVSTIAGQNSKAMTLSLPVYNGKLVRKETLRENASFISVAQDGEFPVAAEQGGFTAVALDFTPDSDWLTDLPALSEPSLSEAEVIIDLGYGIRDRAGLELAQQLKQALETLRVAPMFGATRKVTQDLKLLPLAAQIGQTGARVNPKLIIALGISGAPQHIDYLGGRAQILCFNKDPDAPLMKLNQARTGPRVHPIEGDLFVTIRKLISRLSEK